MRSRASDRAIAALGLALAAALACAVSVALASCSKVSTGGPLAGNPWTVHGVLRIGAYEDIDSLNPVLSDELYATNVFQLLFSGLIDYDDRGNPVPDVALAVPSTANGGISPDGKTITYHLRRGVQWSDGAPLTAADVVFTWQQIMNPRNNVAYRYPYDEALSVTAPDADTVVARLRAPSAPFIAGFMRNGSIGSIIPEHLLGGASDLNRSPFNALPTGSGPFVLERWKPGSGMVFKANPRYFRGPPKLAEIDYQIIPNETSLLTAVESHAIDLYFAATETQYPLLKRVEGYRVTAVPNLDYEHIVFNCQRAPLDDVRVRRALAYAIDWQRINLDAYHGVDTPGMADQSPVTWAYDPAVVPYPHDLSRARLLLASAGFSPGPDGVLQRGGQRFAVTITTVVGNETRLEAEELVQRDLREVGIDVAVRNFPANLLFAAKQVGGVLAVGHFDLALYGWSENPDPDDTTTIGPDDLPPTGVNYSFYVDRDIGRWQDAGDSIYDRAKRRPYYFAIQQRIHDEVPFHTINWQAHIDAVNDDLRGFRPVPAVSDFWNSYEWSI